jgi:hypothetical protein
LRTIQRPARAARSPHRAASAPVWPRRCTLAFNEAPSGGGAALGGGVATSIADSTFAACAAPGGAGGALALSGAGSATSATNTSFAGGAAARGAVAALADTHNLTLTGCAAAGNAASEGGGFVYATPSAEPSLAAALTLAALSLTNNSAPAGALFYSAAGALSWPPCAACTVASNAASNYGPLAATAPTAFNITLPATTRSGATLPLTAALFDAYGTRVMSWPGLAAQVVSQSFTVPPVALSGWV